ncbi:MAG TPA: uracil-DNA glycosylase [Elusimicrobiota bacterium]|nr:uracil-DNA glycosylase [Elusimicrobiota bacterium]
MSDDPRRVLAGVAGELKRHLKERPAATLRSRKKSAPRAKQTPPPATIPTAVPTKTPATPAAEVASWDWLSDPIPAEKKLQRLRELIGDCRRCPLGAPRIQLAFGVGNPEARVLFIGEGPGYAEDRKGEPFVGPAGQLLDKILAATELSRQAVTPAWKWVYIANMVKCHPMIDPTDNTKRGNDRPPTPEEMAVCSPFLMAQIRIVRPLFIVALGATAGKALLRTEEGISKFRGRWFDYSPDGDPALKIRLLPTYHPAALLRNPALKKDVWEDMKNLKAELEKAAAR